MTQEELSERLSVTRQAVSNWECGKVEPDIATLHRLAAVLHISVDTLIHGCQRFVSLVQPAITDKDKQIFEVMLLETRAQLAATPSLSEVFALHTAQGNIYYQSGCRPRADWMPGDYRGEEAAVIQLAEHKDTHVCHLVLMYSDGEHLPQPEPLGWYMTQRLLELDPRNLNALVLGWGGIEGDYVVKPLHILAPHVIVKRYTEENL